MFRRSAFILALAGLISGPFVAPVYAEPLKYEILAEDVNGSWTTRMVRFEVDGLLKCTMYTSIPGNSGMKDDFGFVEFYFLEESEKQHFGLNRTTWNLKGVSENTKVPIVLAFNNGDSMHYTFDFAVTGDAQLTAMFYDGKFNEFASEFIRGRSMHVAFENGNEPQWNMNLTGSTKALKSYSTCVDAVKKIRDSKKPSATGPTSPLGTPTSPVVIPTSPLERRI